MIILESLVEERGGTQAHAQGTGTDEKSEGDTQVSRVDLVMLSGSGTTHLRRPQNVKDLEASPHVRIG